MESELSKDHELAPGQVDEKFMDHAQFPRNLGVVPQPSGYANGIGQCGDSVEVTLAVDGDLLKDIRVAPHGCVYTVVCASAMSELAKGRTLDEALTLEPEDITRTVGGLPEDHLHCARLAINTLGEAIADHYQKHTGKAAP
ncbi:hypothetical protein AAU61_13435 [Desulfocarbo indianensis]|nr:hypothetical protein AAU61_13435 [Desulfocarbo indianensis]